MGANADRDAAFEAALAAAMRHAQEWLASLHDRPVPAQASVEELTEIFGGPLPDDPTDPVDVIELLEGMWIHAFPFFAFASRNSRREQPDSLL